MLRGIDLEKAIKLSVVIVNNNSLSTLPRAIDSIRGQGCNVEIIIVDDGSVDGSREWLALQTDIKAIFTHRVGVSKARNVAIQHCSCDMIAFLEPSDYWLPGKLTRQLNLHVLYPELRLSFTDYMHISISGKEIITCFNFWSRFKRIIGQRYPLIIFKNFTPLIFTENMIGTSTVVVKKSALVEAGGFEPTLSFASDWELWLKVAQQGEVGVLNLPLCHYTHEVGGWANQESKERLGAMKFILKKHASAVKARPFTLIRGYLRLITYRAEYNREQHAYVLSILHELFAFCFQPQWCRVRVVGGDILRILSLKQAKMN